MAEVLSVFLCLFVVCVFVRLLVSNLSTLYTISMPQSTGTLYLVSTPIGNLGDLSPRAKEVLNSVTYVLCESTGESRKLVISAPLLRYERKGYGGDVQKTKVLEDLRSGNSVALVSNAGTPLISDPGLSLVAAVVGAGLPVVHIPGAAAFVSAVVTSGFPAKNILFIGFLPKKSAAIENKFEQAKSAIAALDDPASLVCYVSKYQMEKALLAAKKVFGDSARISLARELTKLYEDHKTGTIDEVITWIAESSNRQKGEFTLVINILQA